MKLYSMILTAAVLLIVPVTAAEAPANVKVRVVNFKKCAEHSKLGKQEQASFEAVKKQMETVLSEKEKILNEMATKFEDADFLDSLSPEAETEMKRKFRTLNQEYSQLQQQYIQALQQTNFKIVQKLSEGVAKAATTVAQQLKIDLILNDEFAFFAAPGLDVSNEIIAALDQIFDQEARAASDKK
ncbi:MAG: OmpH family outer membrane protein [Parachlamydiaceae bacterium]|nr:OmpH family outer membrane protein [Parachlamydiaceae bacterium]